VRGLKGVLDRLYTTFDRDSISPDPLEFVHRFTEPGDQEIAGLIASSLAYGRVDQIKRSINRVMEVMEWSPYDFTMAFSPKRDMKRFNGFVRRFNSGDDVACLISFARQMIEEAGSIGGFFMRGVDHNDGTIKNALTSFTAAALALDSKPIYGAREVPEKAGVRFFFPSPKDGSPCKRLNLYLRWMVRRGDTIDLGLWRDVEPATLIIPLDTHIARISQNIGLTMRRSPDWKMAEEITAHLAKLDPEDPVKYDFALCRLGILDYCPKRRDPAKCLECLIKELCVL